jgi:hypothetical protein
MRFIQQAEMDELERTEAGMMKLFGEYLDMITKNSDG